MTHIHGSHVFTWPWRQARGRHTQKGFGRVRKELLCFYLDVAFDRTPELEPRVLLEPPGPDAMLPGYLLSSESPSPYLPI